MTTTSLLVESVKTILRQRGATYAMVARAISLSEASVKRLFAQRDMSAKRLEQICQLMQVDLGDVLEMARGADKRIQQLTPQQEATLIREPKLLLVAMLVVSHWPVEHIVVKYRLSELETVRLLTRLDRMKIIDLLPGNRVKVRLARNFAWREGGPIQRFFEERVQAQFFRSSFRGLQELRLMVHGMLSAASNQIIQKRIKRLAEEFDTLAEADRKLALDERHGTSPVMAIRPWELDIFAELRRPPA
ncbi:MAG: helix-turn-helix transcriptional regulator [Betaproteobacteria bacterium]|nr:helix-turn-helix transcriptional regulator [Betaproteobacteria bacterium]